jgi:predicted PhzF superfamily epimerase YddE/YHI9
MDHDLTLRVAQIDAFTDAPFAGNPAAVVVLEQPADAAWMQAVAAEVNLSETAFLVPPGERDDSSWGVRWFTPTVEVDLCGHATLASAFHLFGDRGVADTELSFDTRSGRGAAFPEWSALCAVPARRSPAISGVDIVVVGGGGVQSRSGWWARTAASRSCRSRPGSMPNSSANTSRARR